MELDSLVTWGGAMSFHRESQMRQQKDSRDQSVTKSQGKVEDNLELVDMPKRILDRVNGILKRRGIYATGSR